MATTLNELRLGRGGTRTVGRKRTYVRKFRLVSDGAVDDPLDARTYPGVPQILSPHPQDGTAFCVDVDVDQPYEDKQIWLISCHYGNLNVDTQVTAGETGFTGERIKTTWTSAKYTKAIETATVLGGTAVPFNSIGQVRPILNSRGDPFNPPREIDQTRKILTLSRGEATYDPDQMSLYEDTINSVQIRIANKTFDKHTGKIETITATDAFENGIHYWIVTYEIHHRRDTWNPTILDSGIDDSGRKVMLDGQGNEIPRAQLKAGQAPGTIILREYDEKDFGLLNLPVNV